MTASGNQGLRPTLHRKKKSMDMFNYNNEKKPFNDLLQNEHKNIIRMEEQ